jgi:SDR family mycofactocin-dependent oxidoreductase
MGGRVEGKVALITGAARGQGRSHALRLAGEGADIVAIDACTSLGTISYPMASKEDLAETGRLVEELDRQVVTIQADVRDLPGMQDAVATALAQFGKIDIVCPNAGVCPMAPEQTIAHWVDVTNINLTGVLNTVNAVLPHLKAGASIVVTGSVAALMPDGPGSNPGGLGYSHAKRSLVSLVKSLGKALAPEMIRINGIHPTNCNTAMLQHEDMYRAFRPDLEHPARTDAEVAFSSLQMMPVPWIEPADVSDAVLFLASDEARYITGQFIGVDAGALLKI